MLRAWEQAQEPRAPVLELGRGGELGVVPVRNGSSVRAVLFGPACSRQATASLDVPLAGSGGEALKPRSGRFVRIAGGPELGREDASLGAGGLGTAAASGAGIRRGGRAGSASPH